MVKIYNCAFYFFSCLNLLQSFPVFMTLLTNYLHNKSLRNYTASLQCNHDRLMAYHMSASAYDDIVIVRTGNTKYSHYQWWLRPNGHPYDVHDNVVCTVYIAYDTYAAVAVFMVQWMNFQIYSHAVKFAWKKFWQILAHPAQCTVHTLLLRHWWLIKVTKIATPQLKWLIFTRFDIWMLLDVLSDNDW